MNKVIVTLTGPSCAGKSTLASQLCTSSSKFRFSEIISTTTRSPRAREQNGVHYHFVSRDEFFNIPMMEYTVVAGNFYGASVAEFERIFSQEGIAVIVVDPAGAQQIRDAARMMNWSHLKVFMDAPLTLLMERTLQRLMDDWRSAKKTDAEYEKIYAERLTNLIEEELHWRENEEWDMVIPLFSHATETQTINELHYRVSNYL